MGRVTSNRCDILRGEEEHPRSEMKTRATERQKHQDDIQKRSGQRPRRVPENNSNAPNTTVSHNKT